MIISENQCFFPDRFQYATPDRFGLGYEPFSLTGPDGSTLTGWRIAPPLKVDPRPKTVLHLHGNAQNMTAHLFASYFLAMDGYELITFDYRGYGQSSGSPSLSGIIEDGAAAVEYLYAELLAPDRPLALFGQSMGAFTAAHLSARFPRLDRVILEAGLISFRRLFVESYPEAEVRIPEGLSTLPPLAEARPPKLFIHGAADGVVPASHSRRMYDAAAEPKDLLILDGVGHIDALDGPESNRYRGRIREFLG
jgi:hypothetical protein